LSSFFKRST